MMNDEARRRPDRPTARTTMTDVARRAGVSQTTVSLVLNEAEGARVSAATRSKVRKAAEKLGYRIRRERPPPRGSARLLLMLVDQISTDPWTGIAIDGARERAEERGIALAVGVTGGVPAAEVSFLAPWDQGSVIGVIYATINTRRIVAPEALSALPSILVNCYTADRSRVSVLPSEIAGGHAATERLIRAGHRRIGFIGGEPWMDAARDRLKGYKRALATWDLAFDPALVHHGDWQASSGYAHTRRLLELDRPPTAIFCGNDLMALGCFDALKEKGRRIPADMAVIGYDDRDIAQQTHPPLTTVLLPHYEMGALAADLLIDGRHRAGEAAQQIKIECPLVERQSV